MSEYQYYEFHAVDRPLTKQQMQELRAVSTRATITATRFVNEYHWGDLKGDPDRWMERYFDAFLYFANWGTNQLMFRLPTRSLDLRTVRPYVAGHSFRARATDGFTFLDFLSEEEPRDEWYEECQGALSSIIPLRAGLAGGDHRALYLGWLLGVQNEEVDEDEREPPVPPGLCEPTAGLRALAAFLRIDEDLITAAAERSPRAGEPASEDALAHWITTLPEAEKDRLLIGIAAGEEPQPRASLLRRFREASGETRTPAVAPRTVAELLDAREHRLLPHVDVEQPVRVHGPRDSFQLPKGMDGLLVDPLQLEAEVQRRVRGERRWDEGCVPVGPGLLLNEGARSSHSASASIQSFESLNL
jgi:hypothetical protein